MRKYEAELALPKQFSTIPTADINWCPSFRIIPTLYPPMQVFEDIATSPEELSALMEIEALTNDPVRQAKLQLGHIPEEDRITGPGAGRIMPCFVILDTNPGGRRFSNNNFGSYYAAKELATAIAETIHHRQKFMAATDQPAQAIDNLVLQADIKAKMHDIRGLQNSRPELYHDSDYSQSQACAEALQKSGSSGIVYDSIRNAKGQCTAVLRPRAISNCRETQALVYQWDGNRITGYYEKSQYKSFPATD
jgi:hypothetical protein